MNMKWNILFNLMYLYCSTYFPVIFVTCLFFFIPHSVKRFERILTQKNFASQVRELHGHKLYQQSSQHLQN